MYAPQGAVDYATNRLHIALTNSPERHDPGLLLQQLLADLGITLTTSPDPRKDTIRVGSHNVHPQS